MPAIGSPPPAISTHLGTFLVGANACVPRIRARIDPSRENEKITKSADPAAR
jgi:hypothetical protein